MYIEKLSSGNYRISEMRNGQRVRITLDHKPTKTEARTILDKQFRSYSTNQPFGRAAENYIDAKKAVLSPTTVKNYHSILRNTDERFLSTPVCSINSYIIQTEVSRYAQTHSAKSTKNFSGFIMGVCKFYGAELRSPKLPQNERKEPYIPTEEEVKKIIAELQGTKYEVPILLSALGLRRSEICALTIDDLDGNILRINKALVQNEEKEWVIKPTKVEESTRTIIIPEYLADLIRKQGYVYKGFPGQIYKRLSDIEKKLGIPHFSLHKMRHFFASYMHNLGYTDKQIQAMGGWKTDEVMKTVYQHAMNMDEAKKKMAESVAGLLP